MKHISYKHIIYGWSVLFWVLTSEFSVLRAQKINGANIVSLIEKTDSDPYMGLERIGADWVALCVYAFMYSDDPKIYYDIDKNWWGDTPEGIINATIRAKEKGYKILIKPHFRVDDEGWAGDFFPKGKQMKLWEANYRDFMLKLAVLAQENDVNMLCIGTELKELARQKTSFWKTLIADIRAVYDGELVYAANWDNMGQIHFWEDLDYIGVDAYFPLNNEKTPDINNLLKKWSVPVRLLHKMHKRHQKPIVFTEFGYRSIDFTAWKQWEIESLESHVNVNIPAQIFSYQALFESIWNKEWFAGGFLWKWMPNDHEVGGINHSNYTPQHKPVEKIIKSWYTK